MHHAIEHIVGIYIGLLLLACVVGIIAKYVFRMPYTIALTIVGLLVGVFHFGPDMTEIGFSAELIFLVFLPPLLFQGALHMNVNRLLKHIWPIVCFAIPGVIVSTLLVGGVVYWWGGIAVGLVALLFGALISPTDPVSVLAIFRKTRAPDDLRTLVEGESLFNDATGVVVFTILLQAVTGEHHLSAGGAIIEFVKVSLGGIVVGAVFGLVSFWLLRKFEDHLLENTLCLTLAYGSFWIAEHFHFSGVIATVISGVLIGNYGTRLSMGEKTRETVLTFFESIEFIINSLLFILIGLELREIPDDVGINLWRLMTVAILAMLIGRAVVSYLFYWGLNRIGTKRPKSWKHILFWGGLRGSIPIALLLRLPDGGADTLLGQYRPALLAAGFACVAFSLIVQGLTMGPLLKALKISHLSDEH